MWLLYILAALFIFSGIAIKHFKWYFLIAGYNTMGKKKQANVDMDGIGRSMGNFCYAIGGLMLVAAIADHFGKKILVILPMLLIYPLTIGLILYAQRYDHNKRDKSSKLGNMVLIVIIMLIGALAVLPITYGIKEPEIIINPDKIIIKSASGRALKREDIESIELKDTIPRVLNKVDGYDLGYIQRGIFNVEDMGTTSIYIHENKSPYIVIKVKDKYCIINYRDSKRTVELYEKLK